MTPFLQARWLSHCSGVARRHFSVTALSGHTLNVSLAVKKEDEGRSFLDLSNEDIAILQGIGPKSKVALNTLGIQTILDLANFKYYHMAKAITIMSETEQDQGRQAQCMMNINKGVDKAYETLTLKGIVQSPVAALQGISDAKGVLFADVGVVTIGDLADLKYCKWAESIVTLSKYEEQIKQEESSS